MDYTSRRSNCGIPDMKDPKLNFRPHLPQSQLVPSPVLPPNPVHSLCYNSPMLPTNTGKNKTKFLNLRDSVKKSPTKSTAKVSSSVQSFSIREHPLWTPVAFQKVCEWSQALSLSVGRLESFIKLKCCTLRTLTLHMGVKKGIVGLIKFSRGSTCNNDGPRWSSRLYLSSVTLQNYGLQGCIYGATLFYFLTFDCLHCSKFLLAEPIWWHSYLTCVY